MKTRLLVVLLLLSAAARVALASQWGLLGDEALWFDLRAGSAEVLLRALAISIGVGGALVLLPHMGSRAVGVAWWLGVPLMLWSTFFLTPEAITVGCWAVGLAAACLGGRAWLLVGMAGGVAICCGPTGLGLVPLLILGASRRDWQTVWPWVGFALSGVGLPWLPELPPQRVFFAPIADQVAAVTPFLWGAGAWWAASAPPWRANRVERLAWACSVPVLCLVSVGGWLGHVDGLSSAPAWVGIGLGLSHARGAKLRLTQVGLWVGAFASLAAVVHTMTPLVRLEQDPAAYLSRGKALGGWVAVWALPEGAAVGTSVGATPVFTADPRDAALIRSYSGLPAEVVSNCAWSDPTALFVRPALGEAPPCSETEFSAFEGPWRLDVTGSAGRPAGRWELFRLSKNP